MFLLMPWFPGFLGILLCLGEAQGQAPIEGPTSGSEETGNVSIGTLSFPTIGKIFLILCLWATLGRHY